MNKAPKKKPRGKDGPKPKYLNQQFVQEVLSNKRLGMSNRMALTSAGIHPATYHRWMAQREAKDCPTPISPLDFMVACVFSN